MILKFWKGEIMTSKIEWTDETWNPIVGCSIVSKGCTNCYAMKQAQRIQKMNPTSSVSGYNNPYDGTTKLVNEKPVWTGKVALASKKTMEKPLHTKKPTKFFVNSMGDLFHENVPFEWIDKVFAIMALCPQHTFIILTKRPEIMKKYTDLNRHNGCGLDRQLGGEMYELFNAAIKRGVRFAPFALPLPNVWLGVSVENQETANERIPILLDTPAAVRFISAEPLLGAIDLEKIVIAKSNAPLKPDVTIKSLSGWHGGFEVEKTRLDWVIVGGESGKDARPMHRDWVRSLIEQCVLSHFRPALFFKQWGEWQDGSYPNKNEVISFNDGRIIKSLTELESLGTSENISKYYPRIMAKVGKKLAGNTIDGRQYLEYPKAGA